MLWNEDLESGIVSIDGQHKELFRQASFLLDIAYRARASEMLQLFGQNLVTHCRHEEMLHTKMQYPKSRPHKQMHVNFVAEYQDMRERYETSKKDPKILVQIYETVAEWLENHIVTHDREFVDYLETLRESPIPAPQ